VKQRLGAIVWAVVFFALGIVAQRSYDGWRAGTLQLARARVPRPNPVWTPAVVDRSRIDYTRQPFWAWGVTEPPPPGAPQAVQFAPAARTAPAQNANANQVNQEELNRKRHVEGSQIEMSLAQIRSAQNGAAGVVDWFPLDHLNPIPAIISHGPAALGKDSRACGSCHLSDGSGRPENASPAGLPAAYIVRQLNDFKNDLRHSADPRKGNSNTMVMLAKAMTDDEIKSAAEYFAAVTWRPHVRVVETDFVPRTRIQGELFIPTARELTEPIGDRLIEVPTDVEANQTLRNSRGTWIAYVPKGTLEKGKDLVTAGGMKIVNDQIVPGKTTACGTCHGIDLLGVPPDVPPLAGRSPSYLAREIFDIQQGARSGSNSNVALMKMVVANLLPEDIVNITAYLASLPVSKSADNQLAQRSAP
jgi:cytochrome c553